MIKGISLVQIPIKSFVKCICLNFSLAPRLSFYAINLDPRPKIFKLSFIYNESDTVKGREQYYTNKTTLGVTQTSLENSVVAEVQPSLHLEIGAKQPCVNF